MSKHHNGGGRHRKPPPAKPKPCPECEGEKQVLKDLGGGYTEWVQCPTCQGRGTV